MGKYDIPAMIDKILYTTSHEKIHYIGHSMGNTAFMVTMNERPEYADKIIMANMLAPVAYVEHMNSPLHLLAPYVEEIEVRTPGEYFDRNIIEKWLRILYVYF